MSGLSAIALGAAPVLGGALLAVAGSYLMGGTDFRDGIKADIEILRILPDEEVERKALLRKTIVDRVDDLIVATEQRRRLRTAALRYEGSWRDLVVFLCSVMFTIVWWYVDHDRVVWIPLFVTLVLISLITGLYAARGVRRIRGRR